MTNNKFLILILNFAYILCIDVNWDPYLPANGEEITIFADVSKNKEFQFRYPMYIHLSNDGKDYKSYQMKLDYLQKSSTWAYSFIIDSTTFFQIDNNKFYFKNEDWKNAKIVLENNIDFHEVSVALESKKYNTAINFLNQIKENTEDISIKARTDYMIAEVFLNDFKDFSVAADLYSDIIYSYPNHIIEVKKSLFTLAYIYANHLDYFSDAIFFYKKFKSNYPSDDLITSIDYELNNLSKINLELKSLLNSSK
ncbi:MAG: hypothetical protein CMG61_00755 [Candidatus Marinimicrobia bacterium]|nr:hypothetical protein [Candidatus Neomarinimicrobiota bacterium]|tara:strand:- start:8341 stop:9099 length:759 start_codon:yes stop_codon:yes gene_type:complete